MKDQYDRENDFIARQAGEDAAERADLNKRIERLASSFNWKVYISYLTGEPCIYVFEDGTEEGYPTGRRFNPFMDIADCFLMISVLVENFPCTFNLRHNKAGWFAQVEVPESFMPLIYSHISSSPNDAICVAIEKYLKEKK